MDLLYDEEAPYAWRTLTLNCQQTSMPNKDNLLQATEDEINISCVIKEYSAYDPMSNEEQSRTKMPTNVSEKNSAYQSFLATKDSLALIFKAYNNHTVHPTVRPSHFVSGAYLLYTLR